MIRSKIGNLIHDNPKANIFQLRDSLGRKRLEVDNPDAVTEFLSRQPSAEKWEVWILDGMPGKIISVIEAEKFEK